jgi:peroxiredoxin
MKHAHSTLLHGASFAICCLALLAVVSPIRAAPSSDVPTRPADGVIQANIPEFELELQGIGGRVKVAGKDGQATLPQGQYILMRWNLSRRDAQGRLWEASFAPFQYHWFTLGSEPYRLDLTGDLTAVTTAEAGATMTALTLQFEGGSGRLQSLTVDGARPPELKVKIVSGKKTIAQVDTRYACCFTSRAGWPTPQKLRGSFQVLPLADLGPFAVKTVRAASFKLTDATFARPGLAIARVGQEAPDFSLPRIGGTTNLRPFWLRGRPMILLFSCGCAPCEEVARGIASSEGLDRQAEIAVVVTNQHAARVEAAEQFRERSGYRGAMLADDGKVGLAYAAEHCPKLWLLDKAGVARWTGGGEGDGRKPAQLLADMQKVRAALDPPAESAAANR